MKQHFIIMYDHSCGTNVPIFVLVHKLHFHKLFYTVENKNWNNMESYGMLDISLRGRPELSTFSAYEIPSHKRGGGGLQKMLKSHNFLKLYLIFTI